MHTTYAVLSLLLANRPHKPLQDNISIYKHTITHTRQDCVVQKKRNSFPSMKKENIQDQKQLKIAPKEWEDHLIMQF